LACESSSLTAGMARDPALPLLQNYQMSTQRAGHVSQQARTVPVKEGLRCLGSLICSWWKKAQHRTTAIARLLAPQMILLIKKQVMREYFTAVESSRTDTQADISILLKKPATSFCTLHRSMHLEHSSLEECASISTCQRRRPGTDVNRSGMLYYATQDTLVLRNMQGHSIAGS